ncbi:SpoIID/LytB domain-containing protein [Candidatus Peregrinibacteria bacterium]|nr:SpoIID/LytB domain-containing protein [Candidatus Peregrinibacteria bacterium]
MVRAVIINGFLTIAFLAFFGMMAPTVLAMEVDSNDIVFSLSGGELVSAPVPVPEGAYAIGVELSREAEGLEINYDPFGGGSWESLDEELREQGGLGAFLITPDASFIQWRAKTDQAAALTLKADFFTYEPETDDLVSAHGDLLAGPEVAAATLRIISRRAWGADETLRYWVPDGASSASSSGDDAGDKIPADEGNGSSCTEGFNVGVKIVRLTEKDSNGNLLLWPLQTVNEVKKIVVHHTGGDVRDVNGDNRMDSLDFSAIVRAIYYYHAVTREWGDIGYNYLIDPLGNVYEGRYGGDKVIGAHVFCHNKGSLGISVIGNYDNDTISVPALQSLTQLVGLKAGQLQINPLGTTKAAGKDLPNIIGHRDLRPTSCPGKNLYAELPQLRQRADIIMRGGIFSESGLQQGTLDYNADTVGAITPVTLRPNERKTISLTFKNTGRKTWDKNTWLHVADNENPNVQVVALLPDKPFVAGNLKEYSVIEGQTGSFSIEIEAGYVAGDYEFKVSPVVNGQFKVTRSTVTIPVRVEQAHYGYRVADSSLPSGTVFQGQKVTAWIDLVNEGNVIWKNYGTNLITLGTSEPRDSASVFVRRNTTRIGYLKQSEVYPGQTGRFMLELIPPDTVTGPVTQRFSPVIEKVAWLEDKGLKFDVDIRKPRHATRIIIRSVINSMLPGEMKKIALTMVNKGDLPWDPENMRSIITGRGITVFRKQLIPAARVEKGSSVDFDFWVQAPYKEGVGGVYLNSRFNQIPIEGGLSRLRINIPKPVFSAQMVNQGQKSLTLRPNQAKEITVQFKNTGNVVWRNDGPNAVRLGTASPRDRLSVFYYEKNWEEKFRPAKMKEKTVNPGETATFTFKVKSLKKGTYNESFQMVIENVGWVFGGIATWTIKVEGAEMPESANLSDAELNKQRAALLVKTQNAIASSQEKEPVATPFRVRLGYSGATATLTSDKPYKVYSATGQEFFSPSKGAQVTLRRVGNNIHVQSGSVVRSSAYIRFVPAEGGIMEIASWERPPDWNNSLNDNKFRGVIEARVVNGAVAYINELPLEDYLKGIAEVSNDAPFEKMKAMAVLARTYAKYYMDPANRKFPDMPYDGSDDPNVFQKYLGYGVEIRNPNFVGAVAVTENEVVTYNGKLVKTPYFSQSDGKTKSAQEVWGWKDTPYLVSVPDPYCAGKTMSGHGVGLSGCGAEGMAKAGKTYDEIIKYYFKGVKIEEL